MASAARELEVLGSDTQEAVCREMKRPAAYVLTQSRFHPGNSDHLGLGLDQTPSDQPHTHAHTAGTLPVMTHFTAEMVPLRHDADLLQHTHHLAPSVDTRSPYSTTGHRDPEHSSSIIDHLSREYGGDIYRFRVSKFLLLT